MKNWKSNDWLGFLLVAGWFTFIAWIAIKFG